MRAGLFRCLCPLLAGAAIYYFLSPEVWFVRLLDSFLDFGIHISELPPHGVLRLIRNYLPDMLWGYALVRALYCISGNNAVNLKQILLTAVLFSAVLEGLQALTLVRGTFDVWDIAAEAAAEAAAVFIIIKTQHEEDI